MMHTGVKNPYAAVWADAERRLRAQIAAIHELGVHVDAAHRGLVWRGAAEQRFQATARARHDELHQHNDTLRYLVSLIRVAAEMTPTRAGAA